MKTFTTAKGTTIPLLDLRGKDYLQVPWRVLWMREEHPDWCIKTSIKINETHTGCIANAEIWDGNKMLATAHKYEDLKGFQDFIEKSETGAIGRALALCGYGTQFAPELSEDGRLAEAPVEAKNKAAKPLPKVVEYTPPPYGEPSDELDPFEHSESAEPKPKNLAFVPEDKKMTIGRHSGKLFSEIISTHIDYVEWCAEKVKNSKDCSMIMRDLVLFSQFHGAVT